MFQSVWCVCYMSLLCVTRPFYHFPSRLEQGGKANNSLLCQFINFHYNTGAAYSD